MIAGVQSESNLGNNYSGVSGGVFGNNDWGGSDNNWIAPHGYDTFHREVERKRTGVNAAFTWQIDDGFELTGEFFYTKLEEHDRAAGLNISNRWNGLTWTTPTAYTTTGVNGGNGNPWLDVSEYDLDVWWLNSFTVNRTKTDESKNYNLELKYDKGGPFRFEARALHARGVPAQHERSGPGRPVQLAVCAGPRLHPVPRPCGPDPRTLLFGGHRGRISGLAILQRHRRFGGRSLHQPEPAGHRQRSADPPECRRRADGLEQLQQPDRRRSRQRSPGPVHGQPGQLCRRGLFVGRQPAQRVRTQRRPHGRQLRVPKRPLLGFITKIDVGLRHSDRQVSIENFHLFSDVNGCSVQWKAIDVVMNQNQCSAGEQVPNPAFDPAQPVSATNPTTVFQGYTVNRPTKLNTNNNTYFLDNYGSITSGLPGVWVVDPHDFDDVVGFQQRVFGSAYEVIIPGNTYDVDLYEDSGYVNANVGFREPARRRRCRAIRTQLRVRQNQTGDTRNYGDTNLDVGDTLSTRTYTDYLPSVNLVYDFTDRLKLHAAYNKTMIPLDLGNYGGGVTISTADSAGPTPAIRPRRRWASAG
jgi:iron complex outermembrane receptor protein